ncbi:MAG: MCP four helix bundle domain-containing protein, partial [Burkholderiaceae bacterium]
MILDRFRIGARLGIGFGMLLLLMTAMTALGIQRLHHVRDASEHAVGDLLRKEQQAEEWLAATTANGIRALAVVRSSDADTDKYFQSQIAADSKRISTLQDALSASLEAPAEAALFKTVGERRAYYLAKRKNVVAVKQQGNAPEAQKLIDAEMAPALNA